MGGKFVELSLLDAGAFDLDTPVLARACEDAPRFFEVAVLQSDRFATRPRYHLACTAKLMRLGGDLLAQIANQDSAAFARLGRYLLYEDESEDFQSAIFYLRRAFAGGAPDVAIDLAVAALLQVLARQHKMV